MADYTSPFATGIQFLDRLGVYEILLPFLLIFTLIYAVLEKSKIFGTEKIGDTEYTKKNLNSMFAFVVSFLVVASSRLVAAINEAVANMVILMLLGICFLLLIGVFHTGKDELEVGKPFKSIFTWLAFIGIILIFLHAIKTADGTPWLFFAFGFIVKNIDTGAMGALILTVVVVVVMGYITSAPKEKDADGDKKEK
jgi:hypothetical protein